jgi:hypothetical protein
LPMCKYSFCMSSIVRYFLTADWLFISFCLLYVFLLCYLYLLPCRQTV